MMSRKDHIDRRLRKIEKTENKALKMLYKQRKELDRAVDDNQKLIDQKLSRGTPAETKIEAEVEKLEARIETLREELDRIRVRREDEVRPLRLRDAELRERLKHVDSQLDAASFMREKHRSCSALNDADDDGAGGGGTAASSSGENDDYTPTSPPPYSPYWKEA